MREVSTHCLDQCKPVSKTTVRFVSIYSIHLFFQSIMQSIVLYFLVLQIRFKLPTRFLLRTATSGHCAQRPFAQISVPCVA